MKTVLFDSRWWVGITVLVAVGLTYVVSPQSIRLDEAQTIWITTKPVSALLPFLANDVHLPLYFTLIHMWITFLGTDIFWVRLPSLLFYAASLVVVYLTGSEVASRREALLTTVFFALSPFVMWYSMEARMYTLLALLTALSHLFFIRFLRSGGNKGLWGLFLATMLGMYTHYFFIFHLVSQGLYLLLYHRKLIWRYGFVLLAAGFTVTPWLGFVVSRGLAANMKPLIPPPNSYNLLQTFVYFLFGFHSPTITGIIVALWPLSLILLLVLFTQRRRIQAHYLGYFVVVTFLPILLIFLVSLVQPIFLARYLIFTVPSFFLLITIFLSNFPKATSRILTVGFLAVIITFLAYQHLSASTPVKEDYRGVTEYLNQNTEYTDVVAVSAPFTIYPIEYLYQGKARLDTIPQWNRLDYGALPGYSEEKLAGQIEEYRQKYSRMQVVFSYDQGYEEQMKQYLDTHLERLGKFDFSPGMELRVYKLRYD